MTLRNLPANDKMKSKRGLPMIENIQDFIKELCQKSGESELFAGQFRDALLEDEEILREFTYYMEHRDFACKAKVSGFTVVDVMVWQMDHFKARLDRDNTGFRENPAKMALMAFDTLLKMRKDPERYITRMSQETGTDYEGKY